MIGVEDKQYVERPLQHGVGVVRRLAHPEEHIQEVTGVGEVVVGIGVVEAEAVAVGKGGEGWHLADRPVHLELSRRLVLDVLRVGVEGGEGRDRAQQHPHGMGVVVEAIHRLADVLVH